MERDLENLKQFHEAANYDCYDIADKLISLAELDGGEPLKKELVDALYYVRAAAANPYNCDYFRILYNVLLIITGLDD